MKELDPATAKKIINKLKSGTTPIDCVEFMNVGNEKWFHEASEFFKDVHNEGDSLVRFVNGYYGDGKTHFLGMLRSIAFNKNWIVSYVTAENTPLNKFDLVYSEIVKNITLPPGHNIVPWLRHLKSKGSSALIAALFSKIFVESFRPGTKVGLRKPGVLDALRFKTDEFASTAGIDEMIGSAIRGFVEKTIILDFESINKINFWLEGGNIKISEFDIKKRIDQRFARDAMRSISIIAKRSGFNGILILLDEAERIMDQSKNIRKKSYGVIRDLLDNADSQGGMQSSIIYMAATPEMFKSEKGFAEYDALRSRLTNADRFAIPDLIDWRGVIVDLTKTPLPHDILVELAKQVRKIHSVARNWEPNKIISDTTIQNIVNHVEQGVFRVSKPRMLASCTATFLEIAEQNRQQDVSKIVPQTIEAVQNTISSEQEIEKWE